MKQYIFIDESGSFISFNEGFFSITGVLVKAKHYNNLKN